MSCRQLSRGMLGCSRTTDSSPAEAPGELCSDGATLLHMYSMGSLPVERHYGNWRSSEPMGDIQLFREDEVALKARLPILEMFRGVKLDWVKFHMVQHWPVDIHRAFNSLI